MRWPKPLVTRLLRRHPEEVTRRARRFAITDGVERAGLERLGRAFLLGYHAMLDGESLLDVAAGGAGIAVHERPFYFEGAAMGYLPRSLFDRERHPERALDDLLAMGPGYRYLYYVGLGFWYGFRHPRRPERLLELCAQLEPLHAPLTFDGWGFKLAFFDRLDPAAFARRLARCPASVRPAAVQGYGRAHFFVSRDDAQGLRTVAEGLPEPYRLDLEAGCALARGFTAMDRPERIVAHVAEADGDERRKARLLGVAWAMAARKMCAPEYFEACLERAAEPQRELLRRLPELCAEAESGARDYGDWRERTAAAAIELWPVYANSPRRDDAGAAPH